MRTITEERMKLITMLGKLIPLGYIANEIDNDLEGRGDGDAVSEIERCFDESAQNKFGIKVARAETICKKSYSVYFDPKVNQFRLYTEQFRMPQCIHAWSILIEDGDIYPYHELPSCPEDNDFDKAIKAPESDNKIRL